MSSRLGAPGDNQCLLRYRARPLRSCEYQPPGMPFRVSATGPEALPKDQAEVDERRAARLAKKATEGGITTKPRKKRASVTEGLSNTEKLKSGIKRHLIKIVPTPVPEWPDAPSGLLVALPGAKGHKNYVYNIKDRLKAEGFDWEGTHKLWFAPAYRYPNGFGA